ncbi:double zinc ribbon domain-containing protein [Natronococcus occultus]|uniref:Ribbon-helix-helix protein, copG family n=1 Tax=Natronococcus occultus SP4 TaxID=694430 RepID=L0K0L9_9EURY|nr:zinc ribbon domain-containing protein [Natronococcus occultus]AGB37673.1 Ribbon-helix-helix protein, copG family [Natronococcus occultus SP4]
MSKITFRADDDLVARLEELEASKSEVMREALRAYLKDEARPNAPERTGETAIDDLVRERVDDLLTERLAERRTPAERGQDLNVTISLEDAPRGTDTHTPPVSDNEPTAERGSDHSCAQCGEDVDPDHVYCPNCGEKTARRLFCDCGDELRSDWSFCPSCGRRTPAADVLESS